MLCSSNFVDGGFFVKIYHLLLVGAVEGASRHFKVQFFLSFSRPVLKVFFYSGQYRAFTFIQLGNRCRTNPENLRKVVGPLETVPEI